MHPSARFHITDRAEMAALVRAEGFGTLTVNTEAGLRAVHVPVLLHGERLRFHVSRSNLVFKALSEGAEALFIASGPHAYLSPDWYGMPDRVATWSYVAVELNGSVHPLADDAFIRLLDDLSAEHEQRLAPKPPWTRAQMSPGRFEGLLKAIAGFEMHITDWRGTAKIDQDKPGEVRERIAHALRDRGEHAMAALYSSPAFAGEGEHPKGGGGAAQGKPEPFSSLRSAPPPRSARSPSPGNPGEE
ncbi:MAG TPA: FMN-binding negative transcriptional regulator [Allosphingosinicella sp.]|jgi:transcriptional regulator